MEGGESVYDKIYKEFDRSRYSIWEKVGDFINKIEEGEVVLDAGCGNGKYIKYIRERKMRNKVIGIDSSRELVRISRERYEDINTEIKEMDIRRIEYEDNKFDKIINIAVIHHLKKEDREEAIKEMIRVLKKGGEIIISVWGEIREDNYRIPTTLKRARKIGDNEYMIPFKSEGEIYERYYKMYKEDEIKEEIESIGLEIEIKNVIYDKDNYFIIIKKI